MSRVEDVIQFLEDNELTVATAESCTAGLVASTLANCSGCGQVLEGGYIVYSKLAKKNYLGVNLDVIDQFGLTSEEMARELVAGLANHCSANFLIGVTGTAESDDESLNGVVCFAYGLKVNGNLRIKSETQKFIGERNIVREAAAVHALESIFAVYPHLTSAN